MYLHLGVAAQHSVGDLGLHSHRALVGCERLHANKQATRCAYVPDDTRSRRRGPQCLCREVDNQHSLINFAPDIRSAQTSES